MRRLLPALILTGIAAALGGCNATDGSLAVAPVGSVPPIPTASFTLPPGRPCSAEISHYQEVIGHDVQTGFLNQSVYNQIEAELSSAAAACTAAHDAEAERLMRASQAKHGYHT